MSQLKTPVAFFIFNRPEVTKKVFAAIRQAKPSVMYVIADGARANRAGEAEQCLATRQIIDGVDWDCQVITNYSEHNLGCKLRISSGLDWVFEHTESAIILEDDCLPNPSFFRYCDELLEYYRYDSRVMSIGGLNPLLGKKNTDHSYYCSRYPHIWGWATWRRAWQFYDVDLTAWSKIRDRQLLQQIFTDARTVEYWTEIFQATSEGKIDTWDYQWIFTCLFQGGFSIVPNQNLVTNLGFGADATHTVNSANSSPYSNMQTQEMAFPLNHPNFMIHSLLADNFAQNNYYNLDMSLTSRVIRKIGNLF